MFKLKILIAVTVFVIGATGVAFAAEGHLPLVADGGNATVSGYHNQGTDNESGPEDDGSGDDTDSGGDNAGGEQYGNHGSDVSSVARDKDAMGTKTLPNGKEIENHGQAVKDAAHDHGSMDDGSQDNSSHGNGHGHE